MCGCWRVFARDSVVQHPVSLPEQQQKANDDEADGGEHHGHHSQSRGPVVAHLRLLQRQRVELTPLPGVALVAPAQMVVGGLEGQQFSIQQIPGGRRRKRSSYLHTGRLADVPQVLAGAVDAEVLVLPQAWIPLLPLAFPLLLPLSLTPPGFCSFRLKDGGRVFGFA